VTVQLAIFPEVAVLRVRRAIGGRQVQVLVAGIRRVFETGVKAVLVDTRGADLQPEAIEAIRAITPRLCSNPQGIKIVIVDSAKRVGDFSDIETAVKSLEISQKEDLLAWLNAQDRIADLGARKAELEAKIGATGEEGRRRAQNARGNRIRNARLKDALSQALSVWNRRLAAWRKSA
jgi:hypothetical protein